MNTVTHTNGMPIYAKLKKEIQARIEAKWVVPTNEDYLYIDKFERPFIQRPNEPMVFCTLKRGSIVGEGFHNHYVQK